MNITKKQLRDYEHFKAEFRRACVGWGGNADLRGELGGKHSAYSIPTKWGKLHASIHSPSAYDNQRNYSSAAIYLRFLDAGGDCPFPLHGEFNRHSHKWNIHRSCPEGNQVVDCMNSCLEELWRRLENATGIATADAMRIADIRLGEVWQAYPETDRDAVLLEGRSKADCEKQIRKAGKWAEYKRGALIVGNLIWEFATCNQLKATA